ncbi:MAG: hypothetical protein ACPLW7_04605 [Minisyncoccia bacterium]
MIKNIRIIILSGLIYLIFLFFEIYLSGFFIGKPSIDLLLLFLIELMFVAPFWWLLILIILRGIIFDSLSGMNWGANLISLLVTFILGYYLLNIFSKESFWTKLVIGSVMISIYFSVLLIINIVWFKSLFNFLIWIDLIVNLMIFILINLVYEKFKK